MNEAPDSALEDAENYRKLRERQRKNSRAFYRRHKARIKQTEAARFAALPPESQERILKHRKAVAAVWRSKHADYLVKYRATERGKEVFHNAQKRAYDKRRVKVNGLKRGPCADCGNSFPPEAMDFDHRDPATKHFQIASSHQLAERSILSEIAKCDLVCSNCHRTRTVRRKRGLPATLPPPDYEI